MEKSRPIGLFDSGVGGTSIWKEVHSLLPNEDTLYLADSANAPYGSKGKARILELSIKNTEWLLAHDCKLIVVACNTATTNAISDLRRRYDVPFIGIEPALKPAALNSKTGAIGILATKGTLSSALFHQTAQAYAGHLKIIERIGTGLVEAVERGEWQEENTKRLLEQYLEPMIQENIDYLVLGCSHYPYLIPLIRKILPPEVQIIDSGQAVARQTKAVLEHYSLLQEERKSTPLHSFYTNSSLNTLQFLMAEYGAVKSGSF